MDYLLHHPTLPVDTETFDRESGVGVVISPEQVEDAVCCFFGFMS